MSASPDPNRRPGQRPIPLDKVKWDQELQSRTIPTDFNTVNEYSSRWLDEPGRNPFPPIKVVYERSTDTYWCYDGIHRTVAARKALRSDILADVVIGTKREAILLSLGVNAEHGLPRTNADKRKAVMKMLNDPEWCVFSDSLIAQYCKVSIAFVSKIRESATETLGHQVGLRITGDGDFVEERPITEADLPPDVKRPPLIQPPSKPFTAQEVRDKHYRPLIKHLKATDPSTRVDVPTEYGNPPIVTDSRIYWFSMLSDMKALRSVVGTLVLLREELNPGAICTVVGYSVPSLYSAMGKLAGARFEFVSPENLIPRKGS